MVVISVLAAVRTTVIATTTERDHSKAQQWLQSAVQVIEDETFGDCRDPSDVAQSHTEVLAQYQTKIQADANPPIGWAPSQLSIVSPLDVWDGTGWTGYPTAGDCYDDFGLQLQRITIQVVSPDGSILRTVQVVKGD